MTSMKTEDSSPMVCDSPYGYGLRICLTEGQVEALGLKDNPPPAGSTVGIQAIAIVTTVTQDADLDGDGDGIDVRLSFQITDMDVTPAAAAVNTSLLYKG